MIRVDVASALIFDESTSDWSLPGGAVEPGETLDNPFMDSNYPCLLHTCGGYFMLTFIIDIDNHNHLNYSVYSALVKE